MLASQVHVNARHTFTKFLVMHLSAIVSGWTTRQRLLQNMSDSLKFCSVILKYAGSIELEIMHCKHTSGVRGSRTRLMFFFLQHSMEAAAEGEENQDCVLGVDATVAFRCATTSPSSRSPPAPPRNSPRHQKRDPLLAAGRFEKQMP